MSRKTQPDHEPAGNTRTEGELIEEAAELVRAWRVHKDHGAGDPEALRFRRYELDADCEASGFVSVAIMEKGEKQLDQENAEQILGQIH